MADALDPNYEVIARLDGMRAVMITMLIGALVSSKNPDKQADALRTAVSQSIDNQQLSDLAAAQRDAYRARMKETAVSAIDVAERTAVKVLQDG